MYDPNLAVFSGMDGQQFQSSSLPQYGMAGEGGGPHESATNGEQQGDVPQTHEQLIAANATLKTRISELELINELYRGRLSQLEQEMQNQDNFRHQAELAAKAEADAIRKQDEAQKQLEDSHRRENILKRRLDEMEQELEAKSAKDAEAATTTGETNGHVNDEEPPTKKARTEEDKAEEPTALSTPLSTS
jgi:GATA-binding protein, other eukaryote